MHETTEDFLVVGDESLSRSELAEQLTQTRKFLVAIWARFGGTTFIPMIVDNSMSSHLALLAAGELSVDVAVIDSTVKPDSLATILENFKCDVIVAANPQIHYADLPQNSTLLPLDLESVKANDPDLLETPRDGSVIVFSSGSTSDPKGVVIPWRELLRWTRMRHGAAENSTTDGRKTLNLSPISWALGLLNLVSVLVGFRVVTLDLRKFNPHQLLLEIQKVEPQYVSIPANLARVVSQAASEWQFGPVESIQEVLIGSGKVRWEIVNLFSKFVPQDAIYSHNLSATEAWRMFELRVPFSQLPPSGQVDLGLPRVPANLRLEPTQDDGVFEIYASGDIAAGYVNEQKSREFFTRDDEGRLWWKSGELVRLDPSTGKYFHGGRTDNVIKVNDHNVNLDEIERLIQTFSNVKMTAVLPVEIMGRIRIVAFVSWAESATAGAGAIINHLSDSLPAYAMPHQVVSVDEFPLTRSGKVDRGALLKIAAERFS